MFSAYGRLVLVLLVAFPLGRAHAYNEDHTAHAIPIADSEGAEPRTVVLESGDDLRGVNFTPEDIAVSSGIPLPAVLFTLLIHPLDPYCAPVQCRHLVTKS